MKIDKLEKKNRQTINYLPDAPKKQDRERKKHHKNRPHSASRKKATSTTRTTELRNRHMWKKHAQTERASRNAEMFL
jgi:hypothetical protein